jgi:hypothetical protein
MAPGILPRMHDLSIPVFVIEFFRQDPFRVLGLIGLACVAVSVTTDFDLLAALGFVEVGERPERTTSVA